MNRFTWMIKDARKWVDRTSLKAEQASGIDFSSVGWKGRHGILNFDASVRACLLVSKLDVIKGEYGEVALCICRPRNKQQ